MPEASKSRARSILARRLGEESARGADGMQMKPAKRNWMVIVFDSSYAKTSRPSPYLFQSVYIYTLARFFCLSDALTGKMLSFAIAACPHRCVERLCASSGACLSLHKNNRVKCARKIFFPSSEPAIFRRINLPIVWRGRKRTRCYYSCMAERMMTVSTSNVTDGWW